MSDIQISKVNNTSALIECEYDIALELNQYFSKYKEGWKFHPLVKQRRWDGKIRFFSLAKRTIPLGLMTYVAKFCEERKYSVSLTNEVQECFVDRNYTREEFVKELNSFPISAYGEPIEFRDYQLLGIYDAIKTKRKVYSSNTASGKSAIQYGIIRLLQDRVAGKKLLIVPSVSLVEQMYNDFRDYATKDENWFVEDNCARLYSEYKYDNSKDILISTWQSLAKKDPDFFEQFDVVLCDESHQAKAVEISKIMERCVNAEYRLAFTGTVPKDECDKMTIIGHFGPVKVLQTSKQAIKSGYISPLSVTGILLQYDDEVSKGFKKMKYQDEISALCSLDLRNRYITNLAKGLKGNTLILTARVDSHGKVLRDILESDPGDKNIQYIFGEVDVDIREEIRHSLEDSSNSIVVANYAIVGTGWSVRNLHNIIFAFPTKSFTRVVQAIGRTLRKHKSKEEASLYDIADSFNESNYSYQHFLERLNIYDDEGFPVKLIEVKIEPTNKNRIFEID